MSKKSAGNKKFPSRSPRNHPLSGGLKGLEKVMVLLLHFFLGDPGKEYTTAELARKLKCSPVDVMAACEQLVRLELLDEKKSFFLFRFLGINKELKYYLPRRTVLLAKLVKQSDQRVTFHKKKDQTALFTFEQLGLVSKNEDIYKLASKLVSYNRDRVDYVSQALIFSAELEQSKDADRGSIMWFIKALGDKTNPNREKVIKLFKKRGKNGFNSLVRLMEEVCNNNYKSEVFYFTALTLLKQTSPTAEQLSPNKVLLFSIFFGNHHEKVRNVTKELLQSLPMTFSTGLTFSRGDG
ncbi:MAG: hypothetical protein ACFFD4_26725 [Candidatus Odinarchaeota archaeon]